MLKTMKSPKVQLMNGLVFVALLAFTLSSHAQKGIPFITNYTLPSTMGAQSYQIIQGNNDIIYVLNQNGVFGFDGYGWEQMPVMGQPMVMAYVDKLFIGGDRTLGYFKKNLQGINVYVPIEEKKTDFFYLFHHFNNTLYATGGNGIYKVRRVDPYRVEEYYAEKDSSQIITHMFNVGDKFFIIKNKSSLFQIHKQDLTPVVVNKEANEEFTFCFQHNDGQILGTSRNKIYFFDGQTLSPIAIKDQPYLNASFLTNGISLNGKTVALSTLIGGCVVLDVKSGETKHIINYSSGLPDDEIIAMGKDSRGGLWLVHGMGISRVDMTIPIESYHHLAGLNGNILSVAKHSGQLFVGTSDGLYRLVESKRFLTNPVVDVAPRRIEHRTVPSKSVAEDQAVSISSQSLDQKGKTKKGLFSKLFGKTTAEISPVEEKAIDESKSQESAQKAITRKRIYQLISVNYTYEKIAGISGKVFNLLPWNGSLLVASSTGLYSVLLGKPIPVISSEYIFSLSPSRYLKTTIYVGTQGSLYRIKYEDNRWVIQSLLALANERITSMVELSQNSALLSTGYRVYRVDDLNTQSPTIKSVSGATGSFISPVIRKYGDEYIAITPDQVFKYYQQGDSLGIYAELQLLGNYQAFYTNVDQTWLRAGIRWVNDPKNSSNDRISKYLGLLDRVNYVSYTDSNEVWVVNSFNQLYKLSPTQANDTLPGVNLYVRQVIDKAGNSLNTNYVKLESANNAFKIKLGAPFYLKEKAVEYQYKLEGVMSEWSDWGSTPEKDFPFFPSGNHTLQFRARDAMGNLSEVHEYPFTIVPPFYQTIWFYILIVALAIAIITVLIRVREQKLIREKQILEQKVRERTKTIEEQKEALEVQRDEITVQRDQIVSQNQDIIRSISYARRIQTAVMPGKELIDSILQNYFILLKPRDIVSGDFFWMTQKNGKIVVTAADCTGHGVPGAFMSLLGITLLTEIVKNTNEIYPHTILNSLRANIKRALSQVGREHEAKDGMDIALCVIDPSTNKVMFAGAYNPLYLVRNNELIEYKGDKMPVGVHINEKESFTLHEISLQKGDCIYMFSDGYVDQFGGDDNRKFMSKNFKELLLKVSDKEMEVQKKILDDTIDQWIGPNDQLDDILVLGIRI